MIKSPYSSTELSLMAQSHLNNINTLFSIDAEIRSRIRDEACDVFDYILTHLTTIIVGTPDILESHINNINPLIDLAKSNYAINHPGLTKREINKWFNSQILKIFNYDFSSSSFSKRGNGDVAYKHALSLNLTTCLYCNSQYTFTIKNKKQKSRPVFDHYFPKSKHPYLALSFYNLIPACYVCNSNLKGSKPFLFSTHMHPFMDGIQGLYEFKTNIDSVDFIVNKKDFTLTLTKCKAASKSDAGRAKKSLDVFALNDRYNFHKDYAGEIITKSYFYNASTIKELFQDYEISPGNPLFSSEAEIIELLLGNFIHDNKLHRRILSKLTKDVAEEFGIKL